MAIRGTAFQFLALATIVLTQTLGFCDCIAVEAACAPLTCATEASLTEDQRTDCCEPEREEKTSCCLELEFGWDMVPTLSGTPFPGPNISPANGSISDLRWADPQRDGISPLSRISAGPPQPPGRPVWSLYCVQLN